MTALNPATASTLLYKSGSADCIVLMALRGASVAAKARSTEDRVNALIPSVGAAHAAAAAAQGTANTANSNASNAQSTANNANSNASNAQGTANNAQSTANSLASSFHGSFQGNVICPQSRPPNPSATLTSLQASLTDLITALADGGMIA